MKPLKIIRILVFILTVVSATRCKTEEIILHGDIYGIVTDAESSQPLIAAAVKLLAVDDTTLTGSLGEYEFRNILPGDYEVEASSFAYEKTRKSVRVESAAASELNINIKPIPARSYSSRRLDFGFDSVLKSFTIKNIGKGKLQYQLNTIQDWITVVPSSGDVTTETDTIEVTINRTGLSPNKYTEIIRIVSYIGNEIQQDTINVLLNGVADTDGNYYGTVIIGTQTWLAENLNTGQLIINGTSRPADNEKIEKYCYNDEKANCTIYGGLYSWSEMMQYKPSDEGLIGTTQGVCPVGWHIPTNQEWGTMIDYLGGASVTGGKLKESGSAHWLSPNTGATNETGFSALPGGALWWATDPTKLEYLGKGTLGLYGSALSGIDAGIGFNRFTILKYDQAAANKDMGELIDTIATSVRCIKDPPKK